MTAVRRLRLKKKLVEMRGGECQICGYSRCLIALDFHHVAENSKVFGLSQRDLTRSWNIIVEEANKCVLVCANCHREIHAGVIKLDDIIPVFKVNNDPRWRSGSAESC